MITIHCINTLNIPNDILRYDLEMAKKPFTEQMAYLLKTNREDGHIYTFPHHNSVLYNMFIKPILDEDGYPEYGNYKTMLCGAKIKYLVTDDRKL